VSFGKEAYDLTFVNNHAGQKGLIFVSCGYAFETQQYQSPWLHLVNTWVTIYSAGLVFLDSTPRRHLTWALAFGAKVVVPMNVVPFLHRFSEYTFLRKVDRDGILLGNEKDNLKDAVEQTFCDTRLLTHTSVVLFRRWGPQPVGMVQELVLSTQHRPWGCPLPSCPSCGNGLVCVTGKTKNTISVGCNGCGGEMLGPPVVPPSDLVLVNARHLPRDRFMWRPFNSPSPWAAYGGEDTKQNKK